MSTPIAFSALALGGHTPVNIAIRFTDVITNYGSAYDGISSTFTCPADGIYAFTATLMGQSNGADEDGILMVNGVSTIRIHANTEPMSNQASNFVVVFCPAGGEVYVKAQDDGYIFGGAESSFSGFLISITV